MERKTRHALCIFVENEFGVLQRLTGLFSARGISIDAIHTAAVDDKENVSQVSISLYETSEKVVLIIKLLMKILIVHDVKHLNIPEIDCSSYVSEVFHIHADFALQVNNILDKYEISVFRVISNSQIYVISGAEQVIIAVRKHLDNITGFVFIKKYNIL